MNKCVNYRVPCPFALEVNPELPCFGTQEQCDVWIKRVKLERPDWWQCGTEEHIERIAKANAEGKRLANLRG